MNWLVYHIVSGHAFFSGVALLIVAVLASAGSRPIFRRITVLAFFLGVVAILISSTPLPYWFYAIAAAVTLAWIASRYQKSWRQWATPATVVVWCLASILEIPYHITPALAPAADRHLA